MVNKFKNLLLSVLYELQPLRFDNALKFFVHLNFTISEIHKMLLLLAKSIVMMKISSKLVIICWIMLFMLLQKVHSERLLLIFTLLYLIFNNLGERKKGELSAYSVFNRDQLSLPGAMTADQVDEYLRHGLR